MKKKIKNITFIVLSIFTILLAVATPILLFGAATGSMMSEESGGTFKEAALMLLGIPWMITALLWWVWRLLTKKYLGEENDAAKLSKWKQKENQCLTLGIQC